MNFGWSSVLHTFYSTIPFVSQGLGIVVSNLFSVASLFLFHDSPLYLIQWQNWLAALKPPNFDVWPLKNRKSQFPKQMYYSIYHFLFSLQLTPSKMKGKKINTVWNLMYLLSREFPLSCFYFQKIWFDSPLLFSSTVALHWHLHMCSVSKLRASRYSFLIYMYWFVPSIILTCRPPS